MKFLRFPVFLILLSLSLPAFAQKLKADEIIAKHLDSIGTPEARAAAKSRMVVGEANVTFLSPRSPEASGRIVMASEANKMFMGITLDSPDYPRETFTFDGKDAKVGFTRLTQRSALGNFLKSNDNLLEDGLLGGVLSTGWLPLNMAANKGKIGGGGGKKIDGKETYSISYSPKGGGDVDITLYFDKETFRHVRTEYKRVESAPIGRTPNQSSGMTETRYKVVEDYSDFRDEKGLMMPHVYKMSYSVEGGGNFQIAWVYTLTSFTPNPRLGPDSFDNNN